MWPTRVHNSEAHAEEGKKKGLSRVVLCVCLLLFAVLIGRISSRNSDKLEQSLQAIGFVVHVPQAAAYSSAGSDLLQGTPDAVAKEVGLLRAETERHVRTETETQTEAEVGEEVESMIGSGRDGVLEGEENGDRAKVGDRSKEEVANEFGSEDTKKVGVEAESIMEVETSAGVRSNKGRSEISDGERKREDQLEANKSEKKIKRLVESAEEGDVEVRDIAAGEIEVDPLENFRYPIRGVRRFGLDDEYFSAKSRAFYGREQSRLSHFYHKALRRREASHVVVLGGSNSQGMGVGISTLERRFFYNTSYTQLLEEWLNKYYPPKTGKHVVHNFGQGAVGSCYFDLLLEKLITPGYIGGTPDLFILETSVNDLDEQDTTCFKGLVKHIDRHFPGVSQLSVHLVSGKDFIRSCKFEPASLFYCKSDISKLPFVTKWHRRSLAQWCRKRRIAADLDLFQIDMGMALKYMCEKRYPLQHVVSVNKYMYYVFNRNWAERYEKAYREGRAEIMSFIKKSSAKKLEEEAPLVSLNTFNNPDVIWENEDKKIPDEEVERAKNYYKRFREVNEEIKAKLKSAPTSPGFVGDLHMYAPDTLHVGRWGHLLLAAEMAILFQYLNTTAPPPAISPKALAKLKGDADKAEKTVYAALTLNTNFYTGVERRKLNKHRAVKGAVMHMQPLLADGFAPGWRLHDETSKGKPGYIVEESKSSPLTFRLPHFNVPKSVTYTFKIGFLKSYTPNMADFNVTLTDQMSGKTVSKVMSGRLHDARVSIFVHEVVGTMQGSNQVTVMIQSLPKGPAKKVKLVGLYVTRTPPKSK